MNRLGIELKSFSIVRDVGQIGDRKDSRVYFGEENLVLRAGGYRNRAPHTQGGAPNAAPNGERQGVELRRVDTPQPTNKEKTRSLEKKS